MNQELTGRSEQAAWEKRRRAAQVEAIRRQHEEDRLRREAERALRVRAPAGPRRQVWPDW
jgi:hypothetical protein